MKQLKKILFTLFVLCVCVVQSQDKVSLDVVLPLGEELPKKVKLKEQYSDSLSVMMALEQSFMQLQAFGYAEISIDSVVFSSKKNAIAYFYLGEKYELTYLQNGNIDESIANKVGLKSSKYTGSQFSFFAIENQMNNLLEYYENNGFPFAKVWLDSVQVYDGKVYASIFAEPYERILIDSIVVHGESKTKVKFLENYLGIYPDDLYDERKIQQISDRLAQLTFLTESKTSQVIFFNGKATVHVFVEKQKANQFDFVLGFLPNDQLDNKKLTITGDGTLHLQNSFGVGEEIYADFSQVKAGTQRLNLSFAYPYFVNLPIGLAGDFALYKNDTLFVDIDAEAAVLYQFGGSNQFRAFYHNTTSNVLNYDTLAIKISEELPENIDIRHHQYGVGVAFQRLDYPFNPRKGYAVEFKGAVGTKIIKENSQIANLENADGNTLDYLYSDLNLKSINYSLNLDVEYFVPFGKRNTMLFSNHSALYIAQNIFNNEKYRIGGANLLRGFDEEAIFTPYYSVFTTEYRFLLSKNSYFHSFFDFALVEDIRKGAGSVDLPLGFGAGVALETKGGIFNLSYALGKQLDNPIQFKNGKIHFGYLTIF
ncbi:MAG: POTRA domain-containing protein [Chitinophagales bacterium]